MKLLHWLARARRLLFPGSSEPKADVALAELRRRAAATQTASFYGQSYFDAPKDTGSTSGYAGYTGHDPAIEAAARIATTFFEPRRVLDVGCAKGYVVARLRERGIDAWGIDLSSYAIQSSPMGAAAFCAVGSVLDIQFPDSSFDLVICIETLEHLSPEQAARGVAELCRVTSDKIWITTPCLGVNDFGPPNGWPQGKILHKALPRYLDPAGFPDPALLEDLMTDQEGYPIHGHLTAASYRWWTGLFTSLGCVRCGDIEKQINTREPLARDGLWNSCVFEKLRIDRDAATAGPTGTGLQPAGPWRSDVGEAVACPWDLDRRAFVTREDGSRGLLLSGPPFALPAGWYQVECQLGIGQGAPAGDWTEVAVLEVRSREQQRIHGLRTLHRRDFGGALHGTFGLPFACCQESDLEITVWAGGQCQVTVQEPPVVHLSRPGGAMDLPRNDGELDAKAG